ncbi:MAG TPA: biotin--[acetyl-CoA-carboxylase] ligase, partial [Eubacteriaceae bacterium]|nr:biotin--[acetyl-CoA-carboxylase] ligase [Eubacteriaceae bacterium]
KILEILKNEERRVSGEELAERIQVSRTAVWKNIHALMEEGYDIQAVRNKGYRLTRPTGVITEEGLKKQLKTKRIGRNIKVVDSLESTNDEMKGMAQEGEDEGSVLIAREQTKGKGRRGKSFVSPKGAGLYMSVLLRPKLSAERSVEMTIRAALAVSRAIDRLTGRQSRIKWVNDVYLDGKKVAGILTEGSFEMETGNMEYVVLGIGINVSDSARLLPQDLRDKAGDLSAKGSVDLSQLAVELLESLEQVIENEDFSEIMRGYRERSLLPGKRVLVEKGSDRFEAEAKTIDDKGRLIVVRKDGKEAVIDSGEVSILDWQGRVNGEE